MTWGTLRGEGLKSWLEIIRNGRFLELKRACLLVVGADEEVVAAPALDHVGGFGLDDCVDPTYLAAGLPGNLKEHRCFRLIGRTHRGTPYLILVITRTYLTQENRVC